MQQKYAALVGAPLKADGRTARGQRTREAVVDALLALLESGDLRPTGPRIAERAGVSLRSVFQHFPDMEALYAEASTRMWLRVSRLVTPIDLSLPLPERLAAFVEQRARVLEFLTPVRRAAALQEPFSAELQGARDRAHALARREVVRVFRAELDQLSPAVRAEVLDAMDVAASWVTWDALRTVAGRGPEGAAGAMARTLSALLCFHA